MATTTRRFIDATECAKLMRRDLKAAYPGVRFSVRTDKYSMGASVDVRWTDGPGVTGVEGIIREYTGATFDGMTDCMDYHPSTLDGEEVHYGADFAFAERDYSPAFLAAITAAWCERYGVEQPEVLTSRDGTAYLNPTDYRTLPGDVDYITRRIMREAYNHNA
jgi:hypothetical protein